MSLSENLQYMPDCGPKPYVTNITCAALQNGFYRRTLWTGENLQTTLMSIPPCGEIGLEIHADHDQFLCTVEGHGRVVMGNCREKMSLEENIHAGDAVFVPAGTWHNVVNTGHTSLKLYSLYAPPQHKRGTIHKTKAQTGE